MTAPNLFIVYVTDIERAKRFYDQALRPLGIHHLDFPYTPDRIWHAIREAKGR